jgi:hypothetical protein
MPRCVQLVGHTAASGLHLAPGTSSVHDGAHAQAKTNCIHDVLMDMHAVCVACRDKAFISRGYDATTHFETTVDDVLSMYRRITGKVGAGAECSAV